MVTNYQKSKEEVMQIYNSFVSITEKIKNGGKATYDTSLDSLKKQVEDIKKEKFLLMVVGEAKSGKSTFINAYLGAEILPMDVKQCTSSIVEIRYGTKFILKATYANGRINVLEDEQKIKKFLKDNAALDDSYRDIPVSAINYGFLIRKQGRPITEKEIEDVVEGLKGENIYKLPAEEYQKKIRQYIKEKALKWHTIVKKIEIEFPYDDHDMKGIEIVDTPGINADGRVGDITIKDIGKANAIMFLKPLTGQALESSSFSDFLEKNSIVKDEDTKKIYNRSRNAMFLVLTRRADLLEDELSRLQEEARKQCTAIDPMQIITIDSKAELFFNKVKTLTAEELDAYITEMTEKKRLDRFIRLAYLDADKERNRFLNDLKEISNFKEMDSALNLFAHKAQYMQLNDFLRHMLDVIKEKIIVSLEEGIELYREKVVEDPAEFARKMREIEKELEVLELKIHESVEEIASKYSGTGGEIDKRAEEEVADYKAQIEKICPSYTNSVEELEKISFEKIETLTQFEDELQEKIVQECNAVLINLDNESVIKRSTLKPDLTKEDFQRIKEEMKKSDAAQETYSYTTGITFQSVETRSRFSQPRYYELVKNSILQKINKIENQAIADLRQFIADTTLLYSEELSKNVDIKKRELENVAQEKLSTEMTLKTISNLEELLKQLRFMYEKINAIKGGIDNNV